MAISFVPATHSIIDSSWAFKPIFGYGGLSTGPRVRRLRRTRTRGTVGNPGRGVASFVNSKTVYNYSIS